MNTLISPPVQQLLARLYAEAKQNDDRTQREERQLETAELIDEQKLAEIHERTFMAVAPEVGRLIYLLVRSRRPKLVVEFGTSFGLSGIHVAAALRDNGVGHLITTEQTVTKAERARQHFEESGLADLVEIRVGDAFKTLKAVGSIDLLLLDGWKPLYFPLLKQLEPALEPECLIIADDTISMADEMRDYLDYVRNPANGYVSSEIPLDDGVELSVR